MNAALVTLLSLTLNKYLLTQMRYKAVKYFCKKHHLDVCQDSEYTFADPTVGFKENVCEKLWVSQCHRKGCKKY